MRPPIDAPRAAVRPGSPPLPERVRPAHRDENVYSHLGMSDPLLLRSAFIVDALRTPIGRYGGALASVRPDDLGAAVIAALVARTQVDPSAIDDVVFGCANQAGEDNRNVARMSALLAGLPVTVPG